MAHGPDQGLSHTASCASLALRNQNYCRNSRTCVDVDPEGNPGERDDEDGRHVRLDHEVAVLTLQREAYLEARELSCDGDARQSRVTTTARDGGGGQTDTRANHQCVVHPQTCMDWWRNVCEFIAGCGWGNNCVLRQGEQPAAPSDHFSCRSSVCRAPTNLREATGEGRCGVGGPH